MVGAHIYHLTNNLPFLKGKNWISPSNAVYFLYYDLALKLKST